MTAQVETRIIDYSMARPKPADIVKSGYVGVARYLSHTPSKNLTAIEVKQLHGAGLVIGPLFWETLATEATKGQAAGVADRVEAERQAAALGYPRDCPIVYAVDADVPASAVLPYFAGVFEGPTYASGCYGGELVVNGVHAKYPSAIIVQTAAWSHGDLSPHAHIFQRVGHEAPKIPGGGYDEDVICQSVTLWGPHGTVVLAPPGVGVAAGSATPTPAPGPMPFSDQHGQVLDRAINLLDQRDAPLPSGDTPDHRRLIALDHQVKRVKALK